MIIDVFENRERYYSLQKGFREAFKYIEGCIKHTPEPGRYVIKGGKVFAMVQHYETVSYDLGKWERYVGHTLRNKRVGLVGFGAIAQYVAKLLLAFDAEVIAYDVFKDEDAAGRLGVKFVSFNELLCTSDVISLHIPCIPTTVKLINDEAFGKMKPNVLLINTARGAIIDENALYHTLKERKIFGAVLDVYSLEPTNKDNPLFKLDNVLVFPHTGAETVETYHKIGLFTAQAMIDVIKHNKEPPQNWLNP